MAAVPREDARTEKCQAPSRGSTGPSTEHGEHPGAGHGRLEAMEVSGVVPSPGTVAVPCPYRRCPVTSSGLGCLEEAAGSSRG